MLTQLIPVAREREALTGVCAGYRARGGWHAVCLVLEDAGRRQVFDVSPRCLVLVETPTGHDDGIDQAAALVLFCAGEQAAFYAGGRVSGALPRPQMVPASRRAA